MDLLANWKHRIGGQELNQKGFSLMEVLIGLVILAVGLLGTAAMQVTSIRGNFSSINLTQGTYVAQDRLEFLKNLSLDSPQLQPGSYNDGTATISGVVLSRSYRIAANGDRLTITYIVRWNDGTDHQVTLSTVRSQ